MGLWRIGPPGKKPFRGNTWTWCILVVPYVKSTFKCAWTVGHCLAWISVTRKLNFCICWTNLVDHQSRRFCITFSWFMAMDHFGNLIMDQNWIWWNMGRKSRRIIIWLISRRRLRSTRVWGILMRISTMFKRYVKNFENQEFWKSKKFENIRFLKIIEFSKS